jgi:hypothetical protein
LVSSSRDYVISNDGKKVDGSFNLLVLKLNWWCHHSLFCYF